MTDHRLSKDQATAGFSAKHEPALRISPGTGERITFETDDLAYAQMEELRDLSKVTATINPVTGPVHVEGAEPGDALAVTIHDIELPEQGWSVYIPGAGALSGPMGGAGSSGGSPSATDGCTSPMASTCPVAPMIGCIGVAPAGRRDVDGHAVLPHRRQHGPHRRRSRVDGVPARPGAGGAAVDRRHPRRHEPRRVLASWPSRQQGARR